MTLRTLIRAPTKQLGRCARYLWISYLRACGIHIGKNAMISTGAKIDLTSGQVTIGDNCVITHGCVILAHDYASAFVLGKQPPAEPGVRIGNNTFIGVNTVVLPNVTIGENVVVGAGSVVTKSIPPNVVAAGNPARVLRVRQGCAERLPHKSEK